MSRRKLRKEKNSIWNEKCCAIWRNAISLRVKDNNYTISKIIHGTITLDTRK